MGIVGAKSTAGRAVKCTDPSKTTKSESTWLGYTLCENKKFKNFKDDISLLHTNLKNIHFFFF